ncbi:MAG: hypothetical protein IKO62_00800 [Bacteroidales bacterium]|nr:hypothetical protein [Bacteroidales bacterium]
MKKLITFIVIMALTFVLVAQSDYSPCYTNNMSKGNAAFSQGKYSEARTYYATAKQCAGGNPSEAQKKISECERKLNLCKSMKDIEGNVYKTIQIGTQCWMAENMRATRNNIGVPFRFLQGGQVGADCAFCAPGYDNDTVSIREYGYQYTCMAAKVVCPKGWHLPNGKDWKILFDYCGTRWSIGGDNGNVAKALCSSNGWKESGFQYAVGYDVTLNNASGFNAMPFQIDDIIGCPIVDIDNKSEKSGQIALFWSDTPGQKECFNGDFWCFYYDYPQPMQPDQIPNLEDFCTWAMPVRCVRD